MFWKASTAGARGNTLARDVREAGIVLTSEPVHPFGARMRTYCFAFSLLFFVAAQTAQAQRALPIGVSAHPGALSASTTSPVTSTRATAALASSSGMPRWVKWGLVGAIGGAVLFTLADGFSDGAHSTGSNILAGAATGFVVVGGGVLLYDSICSGGSRSGFCGR